MQTEILLVRDLVRSLGADERAAMRLVAEGSGDGVSEEMRTGLLACFPHMLRSDPTDCRLRFATPELAALLAKELSVGAGAQAESAADEIVTALATGDTDAALAGFAAAGGIFFIHFHGPQTTLRVLNAFPLPLRQNEPMLVLAFSMQALKAGSISRARHLIRQRFGPDALDLGALLDAPDRYPVQLRLFRFLMTMYEDTGITDQTRARLFEALGEVALDDHLQRGSFYNAMLEIHVRRRELDIAADLARRARHHYAEADAHLLGFYVDIYQAMLGLMRGSPAEAFGHAQAARQTLARIPFQSASDGRVLALLELVIAYEQGDMQALLSFLAVDFDQLIYGEMWPTLAEMTIDYGANVLARDVALNAGRMFLNRWRVQEWRSNRFRLAVTMREATLLQGANRWQEAADLLNAVQSRVNRTWVEGAVDSLFRLVDAGEIAMAMAWLRHLVWEVPERPLLRAQLEEMQRNLHVTERQRITLHVWAAHLARSQRDLTQARASLVRALEASARLGTVMPLVEEGGMVHRLVSDGRIGRFVATSADARKSLKGLELFDAPASEGARKAGLTRREIKVLSLVAEGGTNKFVARQLGLSEVTVKFHLSNIFRKMGCRRRSEAIASARALGWVG